MAPKNILVIGNSDGIGLAATRRLLEEGWEVTGLSRSASSIAHDKYQHTVMDVSAPQYETTLTQLLAQRGPFNVCLYCAGIGREFSTDDLSADLLTMEVNLMAALKTANVIIPSMLAQRDGHFIVLSSLADELISPDSPAYCASKAALSSYFEGLALALRPRQVALTNIRFGFVDTKMAKASVRPFMFTVEKSVEVIMRALSKRPIRVSTPLRTALLVKILRSLGIWKVRLSRGPAKLKT